MRTVLTGLLALALTAVPATAVSAAANSWTLLFYMVGDDADSAAIEEAAIGDLDILAENGPPPGVAYLAQVDRGKKLTAAMRERYQDPNYGGAMRYRIGKGTWGSAAQIGEVNSGDPKALAEFLAWGMKEAPADRYMLVISSHGSGTMSWRGAGAVGSAVPGQVNLNLSSFVAYDDTDNDCLTVFELAAALDTMKAARGGKALEVLGLDACLAATTEALFQLRRGTDLVVASPSTIPMSGFAYRTPLAALRADTALAPEKLAESFVKAFIDAQDSGNQVMGAFRTAAAEDLTAALDRLSIELVRAQREVGGVKLASLSVYGDSKLYWDVKRIAERVADPATDLKGATNAEALRQAARDVLEARRTAVQSLWFMGTFSEQKVGGLSLYWPDGGTYKKHRAFYKALEHSRATHWDEYLDLRELGLAD